MRTDQIKLGNKYTTYLNKVCETVSKDYNGDKDKHTVTAIVIAKTTGNICCYIDYPQVDRLVDEDRLIDWRVSRHILIDNIDRFLGKHAIWIKPENLYTSASDMDGACCSKCKEFSPYANDNFVCYACRTDPYRNSFSSTDY